MSLIDFRIPRRASSSVSRPAGGSVVNRDVSTLIQDVTLPCQFCRHLHPSHLYCGSALFRLPQTILGMSGSSGSDSGGHSPATGRGRSRSRSSSRSASRSGSKDRAEAHSSDSNSNEEGEVKTSDEDNVDSDLLVFLNKLKRPDDKEVTCRLDPGIIKLYFDKCLGEGKLSKDAREELAEKYHLSEKRYKKLSPPDLSQAKLHMVAGLGFSGLSNTMMGLHRSVRDVARLQLTANQRLGTVDKLFEEYQPVHLFGDDMSRAQAFVPTSKGQFSKDVTPDKVTTLVNKNSSETLAKT